MILLIVWLVFFIILAVQAYEGWNKTKEIIISGEKPNIYLILYTGFACLFVFVPVLVFYLKMIYSEQERLKTPPIIKDESSSISEPDTTEQNKAAGEPIDKDEKKSDEQ